MKARKFFANLATSLVLVTKLNANFFGFLDMKEEDELLGNSKVSLEGLELGVNIGGIKKWDDAESADSEMIKIFWRFPVGIFWCYIIDHTIRKI